MLIWKMAYNFQIKFIIRQICSGIIFVRIPYRLKKNRLKVWSAEILVG